MLNALFDAQAKAIVSHGGEILKFIGDGLLSIFPIDSADKARAAAHSALAAAIEAVESVRGLTNDPSLTSEPPFEIVVALHIGTAIYGNVGAADRLDFTVIGPAVNLVSRIEAVAKKLKLPIVVSDDFARAYGNTLQSLGRHQLRGLATPHYLFAPIPSASAESTRLRSPSKDAAVAQGEHGEEWSGKADAIERQHSTHTRVCFRTQYQQRAHRGIRLED
jgi:adenylate cyclase